MNDFYKTYAGKLFFDHQMPSLVNALHRVADELKRCNDNFEKTPSCDVPPDAEVHFKAVAELAKSISEQRFTKPPAYTPKGKKVFPSAALAGVDWELLHKQRLALGTLLTMSAIIPSETAHFLEGILNLLDALQDEAEVRGVFEYPSIGEAAPE